MRFGIGQLVRVKYFKDLVKENEVQPNGEIIVGGCIFLREMKVYCGETYKVKQIFGDEYELNGIKDFYFHKDYLELPNKAENDTTSHEIVEDIQEVEKPKRTYTKRKVE